MCIFLGDKHDMKSNQIELQYMFSCSYDYEFWPFFNFYGLMALLLSLKFITIGLPYLSRLVHKLCKGYFLNLVWQKEFNVSGNDWKHGGKQAKSHDSQSPPPFC